MDVTIFEGEESSKARTQGGSLDLHTNTGIAALKECGFHGQFEKHARYDGEATALADKHNRRYISIGGTSSSQTSRGRPEIDRTTLRDILADPLSDDGTIRWGHRLKGVDDSGTLHFASGTATGFDLVVGADGAWSKVRKTLTDEVPKYSGIGGFEADIPKAAEQRPWIHRLTNRGTWTGLGECRSVACQQMGNGAIHTYFWGVRPEDWTKAYDLNDPVAIREGPAPRLPRLGCRVPHRHRRHRPGFARAA